MTKMRASTQPAKPRTRRVPRPHLFALYQAAVQSPEAEIDFIDRAFRRLKGRLPRTLREDFCGTGLLACQWAGRRPGNLARGLDLDPKPLKWGEENNRGPLRAHVRERVQLVRADVLKPPALPVEARAGFDVVAALNFSYWIFHERATLLSYFTKAREQLAPDGLLLLDFMGGGDCHMRCTDRNRRNLKGFGPFTYLWEHAEVEPIAGRTVCKIHFEFPPTSSRPRRIKPMRNAFVYDWRLWGVRELCDILTDAGFNGTRVFWEGEKADGSGNGIFRESRTGTPDRSYVGYIVAER